MPYRNGQSRMINPPRRNTAQTDPGNVMGRPGTDTPRSMLRGARRITVGRTCTIRADLTPRTVRKHGVPARASHPQTYTGVVSATRGREAQVTLIVNGRTVRRWMPMSAIG